VARTARRLHDQLGVFIAEVEALIGDRASGPSGAEQ
jgi:hypothetical protein